MEQNEYFQLTRKSSEKQGNVSLTDNIWISVWQLCWRIVSAFHDCEKGRNNFWLKHIFFWIFLTQCLATQLKQQKLWQQNHFNSNYDQGVQSPNVQCWLLWLCCLLCLWAQSRGTFKLYKNRKWLREGQTAAAARNHNSTVARGKLPHNIRNHGKTLNYHWNYRGRSGLFLSMANR